MQTQPIIAVGIMAEPKIKFTLFGEFSIGCKIVSAGSYSASLSGENIVLKNKNQTIFSGHEIIIKSGDKADSFQLKNVTIGINFHWEQKEEQQFKGSLKLIRGKGYVRCINLVPLEEYLQSVISSEMSATASPEFLKAHAVISRSWLLAQIDKSKKTTSEISNEQTAQQPDDELTRWYDREDHNTFDVCADDHCQRYQGITKIISKKASEAVVETAGEVLVFDNKICDARFSKCCGGITENFENVWEPVRHRYLIKVVDSEFGDSTCVDLRQNNEAELWIKAKPHAFCNTTNKKILSQVLPDFDQSTTNFYRWKVEYSQKELSELIKKKSEIDFGEIISLEPFKRGHSGRLIKLKITGSKKTMIVGKELEIRKWLSETHLYSSAFIVDYKNIKDGIPQKFVITGAGWGHGVGLCQIGAAVMGEKGYSYKQILEHYFKGARLEKQF